MKCPYCDKEMKQGRLFGDSRQVVRWIEKGTKFNFWENLIGKGRLSSTKYTLCHFKTPAAYCDTCKKMIIDTDLK